MLHHMLCLNSHAQDLPTPSSRAAIHVMMVSYDHIRCRACNIRVKLFFFFFFFFFSIRQVTVMYAD